MIQTSRDRRVRQGMRRQCNFSDRQRDARATAVGSHQATGEPGGETRTLGRRPLRAGHALGADRGQEPSPTWLPLPGGNPSREERPRRPPLPNTPLPLCASARAHRLPGRRPIPAHSDDTSSPVPLPPNPAVLCVFATSREKCSSTQHGRFFRCSSLCTLCLSGEPQPPSGPRRHPDRHRFEMVIASSLLAFNPVIRMPFVMCYCQDSESTGFQNAIQQRVREPR